jgi:DNA-binding FadR family transcriptional regulator
MTAQSGLPPVERAHPGGAPARTVRRNGKAGQRVAREILRSITDHRLAAGARLPGEAEMMADYEVGRSTVREALRILEVNGLIGIRTGPGGGPFVREASTHDFGRMATLFFNVRGSTLRELIEARLIMEPMAARLAAERRTPESLPRLRGLVFDPSDDEGRFLGTSSDFHDLVAELAGNGIVSLFCQSLGEVLHAQVRGSLFPPGKARRDVAAAHAAVAQAIVDGDADTAQRLMQEHMQEYARYVRKAHPAMLDEVIDWLG